MVVAVVDAGAADRGLSVEGGIGGGKPVPVGIGILSKLELFPDKRPFRR